MKFLVSTNEHIDWGYWLAKHTAEIDVWLFNTLIEITTSVTAQDIQSTVLQTQDFFCIN